MQRRLTNFHTKARKPLKRKTRLHAKTPLRGHRKPVVKRKVAKKAKSKKQPSIRQLKDRLWKECRRITRNRYGNTCYTCGKTGLEGSSWQTGHFIASSVCSTEMRYCLENLRIQCWRCNINLSGNWIAFEKHLKEDGIDVEALKQRNEDTKGLSYHTDWFQAKIEEYRALD